MAGEQSSSVFDNMTLQMVLSPFKWVFSWIFILAIIFSVAISCQMYFNTAKIIDLQQIYTQEYHWQIQLTMGKHWINGISNWVLSKLNWLLFEATGIYQVINSPMQQDGFTRLVMAYADRITTLFIIVELIAIRVGTIAISTALLCIMNFNAMIDGMVARSIRQASAGRESAGIYHKAKYFRKAIYSLTALVYLSWPNSVHPVLLLIPVFISVLLTQLQFKYWKKYF